MSEDNPLEYDSKVVFVKRHDNRYPDGVVYELHWNHGMIILTRMNQGEFDLMMECLKEMRDYPPDWTKSYYFPTMRHKVTG
jgi:hypothetical protein